MPPKRRLGGTAEAGSPPPVWMIKEAARAAAQKSVEEFGKVLQSPRLRGTSPVSTPRSGATLLSVAITNASRNFCHHCGRPCAPKSHFCTMCGQNLGTPAEPTSGFEECTSQNRKRQKRSKAQIWRCVYQHGVDIRQFPSIASPRTMHGLEPGDEFEVDCEQRGHDGILYLKLADGRGWVFDQKPSLGVICAKGQARPGNQQKPRPGSSATVSSPANLKDKAPGSQSKGRNQSRKASPNPAAADKASPKPPAAEKVPPSEPRGRSPSAKEKASPVSRSLAASLDKAQASPKPPAKARELEKAPPPSERRGRSPKAKEKASPTPRSLCASLEKASPQPAAKRSDVDKAPASEQRGRSPRRKQPSPAPKPAAADKVLSPKRSRSPSKKAPPARAPRNRLEEPTPVATTVANAGTKKADKDAARARSRTNAPMQRKSMTNAATLGSDGGRLLASPPLSAVLADAKGSRASHAGLLERLRQAGQATVPTPLRQALPRSPKPNRSAREAPVPPRAEEAKVSLPSGPAVLPRKAAQAERKEPKAAPSKPEAAAPLAHRPTPARKLPCTEHRAPAAAVAHSAPQEVQEAPEPEPAASEASEASELSTELWAQEAAARQFHQMEASAKNAWQQAKAVAEALASQKEEETAQAEAKRRLAKAASSRQAAEARAAEVESSLECLRREIAQVEEESRQRLERLKSEADDAARQKDACLVEALAAAQGSKEDAERRLQSLQQRRSAELRLAKEKYADEHEALLQRLADHQLKSQGPVIELEARAEGQRQAAAAEARAQEAAAPQLAALKSEVVEAERRAAAAEEARKRSEARALAEESRLKDLLDLIPEAEAEALKESRELVAEADRLAQLRISEAEAASELAARAAEQRVSEAQELLASERTRTRESIERHLEAAASAQRQAEEAAAAAEQAATEAEEETARALKESSDAYTAAKGEAETRTAAAQSQRRETERQVAESIAGLRAENARKVLAATRASEEAAQTAKMQVEALQAKFQAHHVEISAKVQTAECTKHRAGSDLEETQKWSDEVRAKMRGLVADSQQQLAEQEIRSREQLEAEESAAHERLEARRVLQQETEALAEAAVRDGRARREAAADASERACRSAERRRATAAEAVAECETAAAFEIEAIDAEAEESFEALSTKVSQAWYTCKEAQKEARQQLAAAEDEISEEVAVAKSRLAKVREMAKAAASQAEEAGERQAEATKQLQASEFRAQAARAELSAAQRNLNCSVAQCEELAAAAELAAQEQAEAFAELCDRHARDEEERAGAVEDLAEVEESRALAAEEAAVFEDLNFQGTLDKERRRIQHEIDQAHQRMMEVESAIEQAVSYSEKSTRELLKYMEKVVWFAGEPLESSQGTDQTDNQCAHCQVETSPGAAFCKHCGHNLQSAPAISDAGSPSLRVKRRRTEGLRKGSPTQHMRNMGPVRHKKSLKW